jgi:hypothetical protein
VISDGHGKIDSVAGRENSQFQFFQGGEKMFHRSMRPVGYGLAVVGTVALLISAVELIVGKDALFSAAKSAVFILIGVLLIRKSTKAQ